MKINVEYINFFKRAWKVILVSSVLLIGFFYYYFSTGISKNEFDKHINFINEANIINQYTDEELDIKVYSKNRTLGSYQIVVKANDKFGSLTDDDKYNVLRDVLQHIGSYRYIKSSKSNYSGYLEYITVHYDKNTYTMERVNQLYLHDMIVETDRVAGRKIYRPDAERELLRASVDKILAENKSARSNDVNTTVTGKNGSDWIELSDNQKFHAISNALYSLDNAGFSILETEYFFIDALNDYYKDTSNISTQVDSALSLIGLMSGALQK